MLIDNIFLSHVYFGAAIWRPIYTLQMQNNVIVGIMSYAETITCIISLENVHELLNGKGKAFKM